MAKKDIWKCPDCGTWIARWVREHTCPTETTGTFRNWNTCVTCGQPIYQWPHYCCWITGGTNTDTTANG